MTAPSAVSPDALRTLVLDAERAVQAIAALPQAAATDADRDWARYRAESAQERWQQLLRAVRDAEPDTVYTVLGTIIGQAVPLGDASDALRPAADVAERELDTLAADVARLLDPLVPDGATDWDDATRGQLAAALRTITPEFGGRP